MRILLLAAMLVFAGLAFHTVGPAQAGDGLCTPPPQCSFDVAALQDFTAPAKSKASNWQSPKDTIKVAFCGQCTSNDDCGVGYKCAGRPECMECVKSP